MEPNMYFQNSIDQNIILSLLPNDERLKDLIVKVKSKDYKNLYQPRRRLLMKRLCGSDDCKKRVLIVIKNLVKYKNYESMF